jgi:CheY-like chemotaxis protein/HD-GYP domain-containing protein (c-di-GMP phosphodiesterase class II)
MDTKLKVLLIDDEPEICEVLGFALESYVPCEFVVSTDPKQALELIQEHDYDLIISDYNMPVMNGGELYQKLLEDGKEVRFVLCSTESPSAFKEFTDKKYLFGEIIKPDIFSYIEPLLDKLKEVKESHVPHREDDGYTTVSLDLLKIVSTMPCDIYISLADGKYVKILNKDNDFEETEYQKYQKKKINHLFLKNEDSTKLIQRLVDFLQRKLEMSSFEDEEFVGLAYNSSSIASYITSNFSLSDQIMASTNAVVDEILKSTGSHKQMKLIFEKMLKNAQNYNNTHSLVLAYVSCAILSQFSQHSTFENKKKLVMASFLHDLDLGTIEVTKTSSQQSVYEEANGHPQKIASQAEKMSLLDSDTVNLIANHHERPNGSGFPRKLNAGNMSFLNLIFILAHEISSILTLAHLNGKKITTISEVLDELKLDDYQHPNAQKCVNAFKELQCFQE